MPDYSEMYAGKYYTAPNVQDAPFKGRVASVKPEKMQDGRAKAVVYFEGKERGVVLNGTRYDAMCQIAKSKNTDDWIGLEVVVCAGTTNYAGKRVGCIELRAPARKASAEQQRAEVKDELDDALPDFTL